MNGVTSVAFRRERVTGDPNDVSLDQCVYFLYAWGGAFNVSTQEIMYHGPTSREASSTVICLPSASVCPGEWNLHTYIHKLCVLTNALIMEKLFSYLSNMYLWDIPGTYKWSLCGQL